MSQTVARITSSQQPTTFDASAQSASLVDEYVAVTFQRFEQVLVAQLPNLAEPAVSDPSRAMRQVELLVETLVGFAIGSAFGTVASAVRRSFGTPVRDALDEVTRKVERSPLLSTIPAPGVNADASTAPRFFDRALAEHKPLLDALGSQLQARLCHAAAEARRHVHAIQQLIARVAPDQLGYFVDTMRLLVADDLAALSFGDQLGFGWTHFVAAITHAPAPHVPSSPRWQRTSRLWRAWFAKVSGKPVLAELTRDQVVAADFVMRIG